MSKCGTCTEYENGWCQKHIIPLDPDQEACEDDYRPRSRVTPPGKDGDS